MTHRPERCPGCGLVAPPGSMPAREYVGASAGCWARFGALHARPVAPPAWWQFAVDAYMAQHPGHEERRAIQSVAVHLVSLCAMLERGYPPQRAPRLLQRAVEARAIYRWLPLPQPIGTLTVAHALDAADATDRGARLRAWAADVWAAWAPHHATVRAWLDAVLATA